MNRTANYVRALHNNHVRPVVDDQPETRDERRHDDHEAIRARVTVPHGGSVQLLRLA